MKTFEEACAIAQQWDNEKATGPAALVARALLARINSLASPQVTDEQIDKLIESKNWCLEPQEFVEMQKLCRDALALSAPPAAETLADDTNVTKMIPTIEESLEYFEVSSVDGMRIRHGKNLAAFLRKVRGGAVMGYVARNDRDPNGEVHFSYTSEGRNLEDGTPLLAGITDYDAARTESYRKGVNDERVRQAEERAAAPQEAKPVAADEQPAKRVRVDRVCPRCRHHGYHDGNYMGRKNVISCSNCSHEWNGRITKDELS